MSKITGGKGKDHIGIRLITLVCMCCLLVAVLVSSTYAWFTANRQVSTGKITAGTATEDLQLLLSGSASGPFTATEASIEQVNATNRLFLMPVSTSDLQNFSVRLSNDGEEEERYAVVSEERNYYHGRIYIKPTIDNLQTSGRMAIYLDQREEAGGKLTVNLNGEMTAACRLGLQFQTPTADMYIFRLEPEKSKEEQMVIYYHQTTGFQKMLDPAKELTDYEIKVTDSGITLPEKPLTILDLNQVYALDIYFYLEGCDPDCTSEIEADFIDLHMAFYGVLVQ